MDASRRFLAAMHDRMRPKRHAERSEGKKRRFSLQRHGAARMTSRRYRNLALRCVVAWGFSIGVCTIGVTLALAWPEQLYFLAPIFAVLFLVTLASGVAGTVVWLVAVAVTSLYKDHHPKPISAEQVAETIRESMHRGNADDRHGAASSAPGPDKETHDA